MEKNDLQGQRYVVEHITTFGFGEEYDLVTITDGLNKLEQIKRTEKLDPQEMLLGFVGDKIQFRTLVTDKLIEEFSMKFVSNQFAFISKDETDDFDNLLIFVVNPDRSKDSKSPEEMHIFRCISHSAKKILDILQKRMDKLRRTEQPLEVSNPKPEKTVQKPTTSSKNGSLSTPIGSTEGSSASSRQTSPKGSLSTTSVSRDSFAQRSPNPQTDDVILTISSKTISSKSNSPKASLSKPVNVTYPKYYIEHLATINYGTEFGVPDVQAGIHKMIDEEKSLPMWVQEVVLQVKKDSIRIQDLDKKLMGVFTKRSLSNIFACYSETPHDVYNNLLVFVVNDENIMKHPQLYVFQCAPHSAKKIACEIKNN